MTETIAQLRRVHVVSQDGTPILHDVSLNVRRGEQILITGPSGSGKSTLLRTLAAIDTPVDGSVVLFGRDLSDLKEGKRSKLIRDRVGVGFQTHNLDTGTDGYGNLTSLQLTTRHERASFEYMARLVVGLGLEKLLDPKAQTMSGGEKQRLALARLLLPKPELILLDEPTAALDSTSSYGKQKMYDFLDEYAQRTGATVVTVSHDDQARSHATRLVEMLDGCIRTDWPLSVEIPLVA